ncbi:MAG: hypothetical protein AVDCRST_MAG85-473, partial [uncultured Solirubrobacteraceae bacterium]
ERLRGILHEPASGTAQPRPPRRPSLGEDHRSRLLRGSDDGRADGAPRADAAPRRAAHRPPRLRCLHLGARVPRRVGRGRDDALGGHPPLPELRVGRHRRLPAGHGGALRRGARPRHGVPGPRPQAPDDGEHGGGDRALHRRVARRSHPPRRLL